MAVKPEAIGGTSYAITIHERALASWRALPDAVRDRFETLLDEAAHQRRPSTHAKASMMRDGDSTVSSASGMVITGCCATRPTGSFGSWRRTTASTSMMRSRSPGSGRGTNNLLLPPV